MWIVENTPSLNDIKKARENLKGVISPSPLVRSGYFSRLTGAEVYLKLENLQETGSFKVRGAYNRLLSLEPNQRNRGVIAASAGNHAQGIAWASAKLGIGSTIVMPESAPLRKYLAVKDYGAEVILFGDNYNEASKRAIEISQDRGKSLISGFDDPFIISGQGTIGLEISDLLDDDTAVIASVGGGGLISGIGIAIKEVFPSVRLVGVQTEACPSVIRSLEKGGPVTVIPGPSIADGITVSRPGEMNFPIINKYVDGVLEVGEEAIAGAVLSLLEKANIIAEGAGAAPLAVLTECKSLPKAGRYILIISGGNIEVNTIDRILHRGSIKMGRTMQVDVNILDAPGSLWKLLGIITKEKANILHINHDRMDLYNPIEVSRVELTLEIRGHDHGGEIIASLEKEGYRVNRVR